MSAFQLPETHLGAIAKWVIRQNRGAAINVYWDGSTRRYDFEEVCAVLAYECHRSVRSRYPSGPLPGPLSASDGPVVCALPQSCYATLQPVDVLKALASYTYQSCETNDWEASQAFAIVQVIERAAIRALPDYDASPCWEIDYTASEQAARAAEARSEYHRAQQSHADFINSQH